VRRRVDGGQGGGGLDADVEGDPLERSSREPFRIKRIAVTVDAVLRGEELGVRDLNPSLFSGPNREDARRKRRTAHVLEKGGVDGPPDVVFVDRAGLVGVEDLRLERLAVNPEQEARHDRTRRNREHVTALQRAAGLISEDLVDARGDDAVAGVDLDVVVDDVDAADFGEIGKDEAVAVRRRRGHGNRRQNDKGRDEDSLYGHGYRLQDVSWNVHRNA
jgi:hypothetical protein